MSDSTPTERTETETGTEHGTGPSQFWTGFATALVLLVSLLVGFELVFWVATAPAVKSTVAFLTAPMLPILDILQVVGFLVFVYAVLWAAAFGPRPSS